MKIAVLADVHANWVAMQAVLAHIDAWGPDEVVVAGDVVNRGPRPAECLAEALRRERELGWRLVRGNHEDYVISQNRPDAPIAGPAHEVHRASYWTYTQLACDVSALRAMPFQQSITGPDGGELRFVHASMRGIRDGVYPFTEDKDLAEKIGPPCAVFCVGHTHHPLVRRLGNTLVVNVGSAGLPFDADTRPSYAQLTWQHDTWQADIIRIEYDLQAARRDIVDSGYLEGAGPLIRLVQIELSDARSLLYGWAVRYQERALQGAISMEESVDRYLHKLGYT